MFPESVLPDAPISAQRRNAGANGSVRTDDDLREDDFAHSRQSPRHQISMHIR
jgi:hypothetical protein